MDNSPTTGVRQADSSREPKIRRSTTIPTPSPLSERLGVAILKLGLNQKEFASKIEISRTYISDLVNGRANPRAALLDKIQHETAISRRWLEAGEGEMFVEKASPKEPDERGSLVCVPLYADPVAAGSALANYEVIEEYAWIHKNQVGRRKSLIAVRIKGDSMSPILRSGDIVVIDRDDIKPPGIFACKIDDGATVKWVRRVGNAVLITAENRAEFEERIVAPVRLRDVLIGRVVWQWSDVSQLE